MDQERKRRLPSLEGVAARTSRTGFPIPQSGSRTPGIVPSVLVLLSYQSSHAPGMFIPPALLSSPRLAPALL